MRRSISFTLAAAGLVSAFAVSEASASCSQAAALTQAEQMQRQATIVARMNVFLVQHFPGDEDMRGEVIPEGRCLKENTTTIRVYALDNGVPAGRARIEALLANIGVKTVANARNGRKALVAAATLMEKYPGLREVVFFINEQDEARQSRLEELNRQSP